MRIFVRFLKNLAYLLFLTGPAVVCAVIPIATLETGQGSDLLDNVIDLRPVAHITLFAIPYLFAMFCASVQLALGALDRVAVSADRKEKGAKWKPIIATVIALLATTTALFPLITHINAGTVFRDAEAIGRICGAVGLVLAGIPALGVYVQWRISDAQAIYQWLCQLAFRSLYLILVAYCVSDWIDTPYGFGELGLGGSYVSTVTCYLVTALLVSALFPSGVAAIQRQGEADNRVFAGVKALLLKPRGVVVAAITILLIFALFPSAVGVRAGTLIVFYVGLGAWCVLLSALWSSFLKMQSRTAWGTAALVAIAGCAYVSDRHSVADDVNVSGNLGVKAPAELSLNEDFDEWQRTAGGGDSPPILILAEGGGIRAAYWTAEALSILGHSSIGLLDHTYMVTGVSGGALGAATFMANYVATSRAVKKDAAAFSHLRDSMILTGNMATASLSKDFLGAWLARSLSTEPLRKLVPFEARYSPSKGDALQAAWRDALTCRFDGRMAFSAQTTLDVCAEMGALVDGAMISLPSTIDGHSTPRLMFVATSVETGARVLMSSKRYKAEDFPRAQSMEVLAPGSVSLLAGAHASARFPLVSPAGAVYSGKHDPLGRVVDGGYVDASGAVTAIQIVAKLSETRKTTFHPIVIDLDNNPEDLDGEITGGLKDATTHEPSKSEHTEERIGEFETVGKAVLNANSGRTLTIKDVLKKQVCDLHGGFITLKVRKSRDGQIGLGWTLSNRAPEILAKAMAQEFSEQVNIDISNGTSKSSLLALKKAAADSCKGGDLLARGSAGRT